MNLENRTEQFRTPFCLIDPAGKFVETNYSFVDKFNLGNGPSDLIDHIKDFFPNEEQKKQFVEKLVSSQKSGIEFSCDIPVLGANLRTTWIQATFTPIMGSDNSGFVFNGVDITNRKIKEIQNERQIEELKLRMEETRIENEHDSLTGLYNRKCLERRLTEMLALRDCVPLAVLFIDLDGFKQINDIEGHLVGDKELIRVAEILKQVAERPGDMVGRFGGDEFIMVLPGIDDEIKMMSMCEKLAKVCRQNSINCSFGWAITSKLERKTIDKLFEEADHKMYQMKGKHHSRRSKK